METVAHHMDFMTSIVNAVNAGSDIVLISYSILEETEEKIKFALSKLLEKYHKDDWFTPLYSCTKELIANGVKANAKTILFKEGQIKNPDDPIEVVHKLRQILNEESLLEYGIKAKENNLSTRIYLKIVEGQLVIEVINNIPLQEKELHRIHDRIEKSSHYDSIAEFYLENQDPIAEGMGLGLSMVVVLLKSININYKNFVIATDFKSKTSASISIPLN